ncbi:LysM peptidoglycan-binding domain-containing protein [Xylanibacillus composti]|uniref:LysM domain-containing protein n=1 Tax=Xylanibacillus composti TaxID=1572762 RepID=A0A8J4H272_9BACL|nr:LysM peptidoglycan-binding domain-containing protein [Xylanibacillus composti]MDT9726216.1 LysM peptidoglycan-binding domain-containing protein [Xylanibacillus composti]GIQ68066.1 hypothetical protein XYCOK13_08900 [Xylanibacillus composti]
MSNNNAGSTTTIEAIHQDVAAQAGRRGPVLLSAVNMPSDALWRKASVAFGDEEFAINPPDGGMVQVSGISGGAFTVWGMITVLGLEKQSRSITIRVVDGEPGFTFSIGPLASGWTFGKWQARLDTTPLNRLRQSGILFHWDSFRPMDEQDSPLSYSATVELTGPFAFLTRFITGQSLTWQGPILFAEAWAYEPTFDLRAPLVKDGSEPQTFSIGFLEAKSPYLQARVRYAEDPETDEQLKLETQVQFGMSLQEEGMTLQPMTLNVPIYNSSKVLYLNGMYGAEDDALSMGDVARWLLNLDAPPALPAPLDGLFNRVGLKAMSASLTSASPFGLMSVEVLVGSKSEQPVWDIYNNQIVLEELYMNANVTYLTSDYTSVNALFGADLRLFDLLFEMELEIQNDGVIARGMMSTVDGLPLSFSGLIRKLNCGLDTQGLEDFFALTFNQIGVELVPSTEHFQLSVYAEADLSLRLFGKELFGLHDTNLLFSGYQDEAGEMAYLVYASGKVALLGLTFPAQVTLSAEKKQFTIGPVSFTFGDMIKFLVQLVHPSWDFELPEPWNVLNAIGFENATLTVDITEKYVTFSTGIQVDFGFIEISDISLTYHWRTPKGGKEGVVLALDGTFLGMPIRTGEDDEPLEWDVVNDHPPEVPGAGNQLFHLEYLGIGQHVSFRDTSQLHSISDVITALERGFRPELAAGNPLEQSNALVFNENSGWLLGAKFTVLQTVTIAAIFNDPQMYGLRVTLEGARAGSFKGLEFEILYKKITDQIGLYHTELVLPDMMRYLEFGEVSITIPVIDIDIYTNGNFKIDIGFPHNGNFERSFAIQVFPFVGFGGFYLAYLEGATSQTVPAIDNGEFKPVIEFGFGLAVGVGKTIHKGPLSAGLDLTVQGILEGTLAWFHPTASEESTDLYYAVQGMVGIVGELFGSLDFSIIKASVQIRAAARALLTFQAYEPIVIRFEVEVEASVKVKVVFVTIHFSFDWTLREQFTIGNKGVPPWHVAGGQALAARSVREEKRLRLQQPRTANPSTSAAKPRLADVLAEPALQWQVKRLKVAGPAMAAAEQATEIEVRFGVLYTQASGGQPGAAPVVQALPLLFVPNAIPEQVASREALRQTTGGDSAFCRLVEGMLRRAIDARLASVGEASAADAYVSLYDLQVIYQHLLAGLADESFTYASLTEYFKDHMIFKVMPAQATEEGEAPSGTLLPMIPALTLESSDGQVKIDYGTDSRLMIGKSYEQELERYFQTFAAAYQNRLEQEHEDNPKAWRQQTRQHKELAAEGTREGTKESISAFLFRDYFLMVTKSAVQAAIDRLEQYEYETDGTRSLEQIAAELSARKPQSGLMNPTAASIALANQERPDVLNPASRATVAGALYQTKAADTLKRIADFFGLSPAQLLEAADGSGAMLNADDAALLKPDALIDLGTIAFTVPVDGYPLEAVAVSFGVGFDALKAANPGVDQSPLAMGQVLTVPGAKQAIEVGQTFRTFAERFGLTLAQLAAACQDNAAILQPLSVWHIPAFPAAVSEGMSLRGLAERYNLNLADMVEDGLGQADDLLLPGKKLLVPYRPDMPEEELIAAVIGKAAVNDIAASMSRFFLHGLRIPAPADKPDFTKLFPLYQVIGQQWDAPSPDAGPYAYTLTKPEGIEWIAFPADSVRNGNDGRDNDGYDGNDDSSRGDDGDSGSNSGSEGDNDSSGNCCTYAFGPHDWQTIRDYAAPFTPEAEAPQALALMAYQPNRYALSQMIHWQHPLGNNLWEPEASAATSSGEPAIWPFPGTLKQRLLNSANPSGHGAEQTGLRYVLRMYRQQSANTAVRAEAIDAFAWGTMIDVNVHAVRAASHDPSVTRHEYQLAGTDEDGKQMLQHLWNYLSSDSGMQDQASLSLLYPANPSEPNSSGLLSGLLLPEDTFLLKANLSSTTHSSNEPVLRQSRSLRVELADEEPEIDVFAALSDAKRFIKLLWEGSAVHSGGYYLNYAAEDGAGLPDTIFNESGEAVLKLVIVLASQIHRSSAEDQADNPIAGASNARRAEGQAEALAFAPIYGFNNCAVTAQNVDISHGQLAVESALYETGASETLNDASAAMGFAATEELAQANRLTKLLLKPGIAVQVGSITYNIQPGDTLQSMADALTGGEIGALTQAIGGTEGLLLAKSLLQYHDGQMTLHTTAPLGVVGYDQYRPNPDTADAAYAELSAQQQLGTLYQLLGFTIQDNEFFSTQAAGGREGLPAGPIDPTGEKSDKPMPEWYYRNTIQASNFARPAHNYAYRTPGLPPAADNPYAGLAPQSQLQLSLTFQDLFGNRTDYASSGVYPIALPFGYRDELIPLSMWPGMAVSYDIADSMDESCASIAFHISFNLSAYAGGSGQSQAVSKQNVQTDLQKLAQLYYQFVQPDYQIAWSTSLDQPSMEEEPMLYYAWKAPWWQAVSSHWLFLQSLDSLALVQVQPSGQTLAELAAPYLVTAGELLQHNAHVQADRLFAHTGEGLQLVVPEKLLTRAGDSLKSLCARIPGGMDAVQLAGQNLHAALSADNVYSTPQRTLPREGSGITLNGQSLQQICDLLRQSPLRLAEENAERPDLLRAGVVLRLDGRAIMVREGYSFQSVVALLLEYTVSAAVSLQAIADFYQCDVAAIAEANQAKTDIWRDQAPFTYEGHTVLAKATDSLYDIAEQFAQVGLSVTVAALAASVKDDDELLAEGAVLSSGLYEIDLRAVVQANAQVPGLFKPDAILHSAHTVTLQGDTLSVLESREGVPAAELVPLNLELANFYAEGVYVFVRNNSAYSPEPGASLAQIVRDTAATYEELGQLNGHAALQASTDIKLQVPLRTYRPDDGRDLLVPYAAGGPFGSPASDTLGSIAVKFGLAGAQALAERNMDMPYLFLPGSAVTIEGAPYVLTESDTLAGLQAQFPNVPLGTLVTALDRPGVLRAGAVFAVPAPLAAEGLLQPQAAADAMQVSATDLLLVNRSLSGLLQKGVPVTLHVPDSSQPVTVETREGETLNTLLAQFQRQTGLAISFAMLAEAVTSLELFALGAVYVLPPQAYTVSYETNVQLPAKIFPLNAAFALRRVQFMVTDAVVNEMREAGVPDALLQKLGPMIDVRYLNGDQFRGELRQLLGEQWNELPLSHLLRLSAQQSALIANASINTPPVFHASTPLAPNVMEGEGSEAGMRRFAEQFEQALKSGRRELKLAVGVGKREWNAEGRKNKLWAVVFGEEGFCYTIQPDQGSIYAMKPLSTSLISRQARMQQYVPGVGWEQADPKTFQSVELDLWAKQFLETVDLVLTAPYAVPAARRSRQAIEQLLASKEKLADKLAHAVVPVLDQPPYAGSVEIARQHFADRLKIRLADAYGIEAIVQFPVTVSGGSDDPNTAPRLSGKPVNAGYRTGAVESIASMAEALQVSQEFLLDAVERMPGILQTGGEGRQPAVVRYSAEGEPERTVTLAAGMTLQSLAVETLGLRSAYDLIGRLTVIEGDSLFAPYTAINVTQVRGIVGQTGQAPVWVAENSLESMAFFFDLTVREFARAVQDVQGLFAHHITELAFEGKTAVVEANDSLRTVAAKLETTSGTLAAYYRLHANLLKPGLPLHSLQVLPQYDLSTAKIALSEPSSQLTYFVDVKSEHRARKLFFDFDYVINELEFDIHAMSDIADYQASSWLSFVLPFDQAGSGAHGSAVNGLASNAPASSSWAPNIGQQEIPVLMRSYPDIPTLLTQEGEGVRLPESASGKRLLPVIRQTSDYATSSGAMQQHDVPHGEGDDVLDTLRSWEFTYSFHIRPSGQDEMRTVIRLNDVREGLVRGRQARSSDESFDFFELLAQFASNLPLIQNDLDLLPSMDRESESDTADSAIAALSSLASQLADSWPAGDGQVRVGRDVGMLDTHEYTLLTTHDIDQPELFRTLIFRTMGDAEETVWPDHVWVQHEKQWVALEAQAIEPGAQEAVFDFPSHVEAGGTLTLKIGFSELNVIRYQSASSGMAVTRNRHLISAGETAPAFVYATPLVEFANPFTPLIVRDETYELQGADLQQCLSELFRQLLDADNPEMWQEASIRWISLTCGYQFRVSDLAGIEATTPMFHYPFYPFQVMRDYQPTAGTFVSQLVAVIHDWLLHQQLSAMTGQLVFDLIVYEATVAGETPRPVLELENILYDLAQMRSNGV